MVFFVCTFDLVVGAWYVMTFEEVLVLFGFRPCTCSVTGLGVNYRITHWRVSFFLPSLTWVDCISDYLPSSSIIFSKLTLTSQHVISCDDAMNLQIIL